jgi:hypothetical protein
MRKRWFLIIAVTCLIMSSSFVSALSTINGNEIKSKNEICNENKIIKENFTIEVNELKNIGKENYDKIKSKIKEPKPNNCIHCFDDDKSIPNSTVIGSSTIFSAPYSGCYSWGDGLNLIDEYSHGCNKYSGSIGAYANAFLGGATAEAMQGLDIYVGRQKTLNINAKIIKAGGKSVFGFGSFSGTEKTWSWDDFISNYHRADVDPWLSWDIIILKIISIVSLFVGTYPEDIAQAISLLSSIVDFEGFAFELNKMLSDGEAEIINIDFSFNANPGHQQYC